MTIAFFDCFSGISGDMTLGALLDCGVPLEALREGMAALPIEGWQIDARPILQSGIHALDVSISLHGQTDADESHHHHHHGHHHGRSMAEIRSIIQSSDLSERVKRDSLAIFGRIAEVEAKMHHSTPDEIHFHEIGGLDSLLDICGTAWCLEYLGIDEVRCSPLPYSTGYVDCAHGRMPVPAPATLELLKGAPFVPTEVRGEMITPTGAGILAALGRGFGPMPAMTIARIGCGAGKKQFPDRPNLLRVVIGAATETSTESSTESSKIAVDSDDGLEWQALWMVESNIDDMNPEFFANVFTQLFDAGALDAWLQPMQMKKNRPAFRLGALCTEDTKNRVLRTMLAHTTTLGVRIFPAQRAALPRQVRTVETKFGAIRVKIADWPEGGVWRATPEHDDVEQRAGEHGVAMREVYLAAASEAEKLRGNDYGER